MSVLVHSWTLKYQKFEEWLQSDIESTESALKDKQITIVWLSLAVSCISDVRFSLNATRRKTTFENMSFLR